MNYTINFRCRKSKVNRQGNSPVELTISVGGDMVCVGLPHRTDPAMFPMLLNKPKSPENTICELYRGKVAMAVIELASENIPLTAQAIKDKLIGKPTATYTVGEMFRDMLTKLRQRVDVDMRVERYKKYEKTAKLFVDMVGANKDVSVLNKQHGEDFIILIKDKYKDGTSKGKLSCLKTMLQMARNNNLINVNIFQDVRPHFKADNSIRYLTEDELMKIEKRHFKIERMENVRNLFIFQCYTALSFCDMSALRKEDIKEDASGHRYIQKERIKTGVTYTVLLLPKAEKILEKYNYRLPTVSNQKYNSYLKEIADRCEIDKNLTTHVGRHTAATIMLNHGLSIDVVAKILGHSTTKLTHHYAKLLDKTVLREMEKLIY